MQSGNHDGNTSSQPTDSSNPGVEGSDPDSDMPPLLEYSSSSEEEEGEQETRLVEQASEENKKRQENNIEEKETPSSPWSTSAQDGSHQQLHPEIRETTLSPRAEKSIFRPNQNGTREKQQEQEIF